MLLICSKLKFDQRYIFEWCKKTTWKLEISKNNIFLLKITLPILSNSCRSHKFCSWMKLNGTKWNKNRTFIKDMFLIEVTQLEHGKEIKSNHFLEKINLPILSNSGSSREQ